MEVWPLAEPQTWNCLQEGRWAAGSEARRSGWEVGDRNDELMER